jgi:hypothetical protein
LNSSTDITPSLSLSTACNITDEAQNNHTNERSHRENFFQCMNLIYKLCSIMSGDNTVSSTTGYRPYNRRVRVRVLVGSRIFSSLQNFSRYPIVSIFHLKGNSK